MNHREFYRGRKVMITGGLGFIGSNLARQLVDLGADVLLVDSLIPDYGGNLFNIDGIADRVRVNVADIRQQTTMNYLVQDRDVIFSLAGQVSHIDSMRDPYTDLDINCRSQLAVLEACRNHNPGVKVVFAGTRQVYGRPDSLPVDETHLVRPTDVNGINKAAGENYHIVYNNVFGVRGCSLRLTNVYGPRQLLKHSRQGFIGWFIRLAIENRQIKPARQAGNDHVDFFERAVNLFGVQPAIVMRHAGGGGELADIIIKRLLFVPNRQGAGHAAFRRQRPEHPDDGCREGESGAARRHHLRLQGRARLRMEQSSRC